MPARRLKPCVYLLPRRLGACNVYAVVDGGRWVLVDTGNHRRTPPVAEAFRRRLGLGPPEYLLVTHWHPDHLGGSGPLKRRWGASLVLHAADHRYARIEEMPPLSLLGWAEHTFSDNDPRPVEPDIACTDGDVFPVGDLEIIAVHTPGHSPGHCAYYLPARRTLFLGDALGGKGGTILGDPRLFSALPGAALRSLERVARLEFDLLAAGHQLHSSAELPRLLSRFVERLRRSSG
jgi:glyoxylase-like metal-dependent hydrolase (beta-lactamase superfamily II)